MSKKIDGLKVLGILATVGGAAMTLLANYVGEKQQNKVIEEKVLKAVSEQIKK